LLLWLCLLLLKLILLPFYYCLGETFWLAFWDWRNIILNLCLRFNARSPLDLAGRGSKGRILFGVSGFSWFIHWGLSDIYTWLILELPLLRSNEEVWPSIRGSPLWLLNLLLEISLRLFILFSFLFWLDLEAQLAHILFDLFILVYILFLIDLLYIHIFQRGGLHSWIWLVAHQQTLNRSRLLLHILDISHIFILYINRLWSIQGEVALSLIGFNYFNIRLEGVWLLFN
jgi:hypothetical protein